MVLFLFGKLKSKPQYTSEKTPESVELQKSMADLSRHRAEKRTGHEDFTADPHLISGNAAPIGDEYKQELARDGTAECHRRCHHAAREQARGVFLLY